jgi:ABC-type multidrug transport system ATPase subunit
LKNYKKGVNGSGKTSTFKMCTGELEPSQGDLFINGHSIRKQMYKARESLGYCPQFDSLPEFLTINETLRLYAELRGIEPDEAKSVTFEMLDMFRLNEFKNILVQNLR